MEEQLLLRDVFDTYDRDSSQELDKSQLRNLMAALNEGMYPTDEEVRSALERCELTKSGGLEYDEFVKAMTWWYQNTHPEDHIFAGANVHQRRMLAAQKALQSNSTKAGELEAAEQELVCEVFKKYDSDGKGQINSTELALMMQDLNGGVPPTIDEVDFVLWSNDFGQTGTLSLAEFKHAVLYWYLHTHSGPGDAQEALTAVRRASDMRREEEKAREELIRKQMEKSAQPSKCCAIS
eukprot:TRINITY_DN2958_c0_g3_i3.p1 TRINITY_DN2958_c0_g3~~TRINITY_DN2958_c0_g3_i3.p1  ORF type:complete len:237 (+),score=69.21 TRINITY_DN2958_c0_g3_i3:276-986(+)